MQKGAEKALEKSAEKAGNCVANKAGDKIVQLLNKQNKDKAATILDEFDGVIQPQKKMTDFEIAERVNRIISGGKLRKSKIM